MRRYILSFAVTVFLVPASFAQTALKEANAVLFEQLRSVHGLSAAQMARLKNIFDGSRVMGQGNPAITRHPMTPAQCEAKIGGIKRYDNRQNLRICGDRYMAPLYDPRIEKPADAKACIDMFETVRPLGLPVAPVKGKDDEQNWYALVVYFRCCSPVQNNLPVIINSSKGC